jgi:hypothetical protein
MGWFALGIVGWDAREKMGGDEEKRRDDTHDQSIRANGIVAIHQIRLHKARKACQRHADQRVPNKRYNPVRLPGNTDTEHDEAGWA